MGREDVKLLERVFSYFGKKTFRMGKPDSKLLEMLLVKFINISANKYQIKAFTF